MERIIAQVDEVTKSLMEQITGDISSGIEDRISRNVKDVSEKTDNILRKINKLDTLSSDTEKLNKFSEELNHVASKFSSLRDAISAIQKNAEEGLKTIGVQQNTLNQLDGRVSQLKQSSAENTAELKRKVDSIIPEVEKEKDELKQILSSVIKKQEDDQRQLINAISEVQKCIGHVTANLKTFQSEQRGCFEMLKSLSERLIDGQKSFGELYVKNERGHTEFESTTRDAIMAMGASIEKLNRTLDLVLSHVTPIWEKVK